MTKRSTPWDNIEVGTKINPLIKKPGNKHIFMFSASTWNRHMIHYNSRRAQEEGLPDVVVQRALLGNYFCQLITDWIGDHGALTCIEWKVLRSAVPGDTLLCQGEVLEKNDLDDRWRIICGVHIVNQNDEIIATGQSQIEFSPDT